MDLLRFLCASTIYSYHTYQRWCFKVPSKLCLERTWKELNCAVIYHGRREIIELTEVDGMAAYFWCQKMAITINRWKRTTVAGCWCDMLATRWESANSLLHISLYFVGITVCIKCSATICKMAFVLVSSARFIGFRHSQGFLLQIN